MGRGPIPPEERMLNLNKEEVIQLGVKLIRYELIDYEFMSENWLRQAKDRLQTGGLPEQLQVCLKDLEEEILQAYTDGGR